MIKRPNSLILAICLVARVTLGADTVATFAKHSLDLDLASVSFGKLAPANSGYGSADAPTGTGMMTPDTNLVWMINSASVRYETNHPHRTLRYGFRDGKLVAVNIYINSFSDYAAEFAATRKELVQIEQEYTKANGATHQLRDDADFQIRSGAMCSPDPDSLYVLEFEITRVEKQK